MIFPFLRPYSIKRKLEQYSSGINQILRDGQAELNGTIFNSIADLTATFYTNKSNTNSYRHHGSN